MENKIKKNTNSYPILITRNKVLFPHFSAEVKVGRVKSINAVETAIDKYDNQILVILQKNKSIDEPDYDKNETYKVGTLAKITNIDKRQDGTIIAHITPTQRMKLDEVVLANDVYFGYPTLLKTKVGDKKKEIALVNEISSSIKTFLDLSTKQHIPVPLRKKNSQQKLFERLTTQATDAEQLCDAIAHNFDIFQLEIQQKFLEELSLNKRLEILYKQINDQIGIIKIENDLNTNIKKKMETWQKEYILREKIKVMRDELGENDHRESEIEVIKREVKKKAYPKAIQKRILDEIYRYESMPPSSAESNIIRTYIDWLFTLPWWQKTKEATDITKARKILDNNHYGLVKQKTRVIEYLAVLQKKNELSGQIICFVGAPGVGKTSFAKSIAEAVNRNFVKISLGGVRDESEIRGHRKTYIGSMPGRIIQGIRKAKTINPLFLLDEIDKMSSDFRGDPASALLEVLDPEQNKMFSDHYLEEEYDLSKVMFITTANYYENIPVPLLDRMEIIHLDSYTEQEKLMIAKKYLFAKVLKQHGLKKSELKISDPATLNIIRHYSKEAGVRQLERCFSKLARKTVFLILKKEIKSLSITEKNLEKYLGKKEYNYTKKNEKSEVGVVTGLAYTTYGGDILPIEVTYFDGTDKLVLTGQLGEVMKESASIALGYIKANYDKFNIPPDLLGKKDIHIHVPEGAVPKDGPSAGVTLTTSIISALTKVPVDLNIAMTGEITLRGKVLPIGGLKEKLISADRSLLKTVFIPAENEKDLDEVPEEVKNNLEIILVKDYSDIYNHIFKNK